MIDRGVRLDPVPAWKARWYNHEIVAKHVVLGLWLASKVAFMDNELVWC